LPTISQFATLLIFNITNAIFQLVLIPILVHHSDPNKLGAYFLALSFSVLLAIFVNFGTGQTALVEIRQANDTSKYPRIIQETMLLRALPLVISIIISSVVTMMLSNGLYYFLVLPLIIAEFFNPQFYLLATYNVKKYSIYNLVFKSIVVAIVIQCRNQNYLVEITLITTGLAMLLLNLFFMPYRYWKQEGEKVPNNNRWLELVKTNILVVGNGLTVHLQQALFLFSLPAFVTPIFLSAYGLIDKLISSFRMLVNAYSNAVMPYAAGTHHEDFGNWKNFKQQQNYILSIVCIAAGVIMYLFPSELLTILFMGKNNHEDFFSTAVGLVKMISPVPLFIALNVLNITELILEKKFKAYFVSGVIVLLASLLCVDAMKLGVPYHFAGYYPMVIEGFCLCIYFIIIQYFRKSNGK
jgi:O-antigen/teichoic acid export membrane protein